jgi:MYXO-CTERM domain-containing protein
MHAHTRCPRGGFAVASAVFALTLAAPALAGPDWDEGATDAGSTVGTAQVIDTSGSLNSIKGKLGGPGFVTGDFQDCFLLSVTDADAFNISLTSTFGGPPGFDPMMFLFRIDIINGSMVAKAILANNDKSQGNPLPGLTNAANDGSGAVVRAPGLYLIAISGFGSQPVNALGEFVFSQSFLQPGVIGGPASNPSGGYLLDGWSADGSFGNYELLVQGVAGVPAPGAFALLALGGLAGRRRQR